MSNTSSWWSRTCSKDQEQCRDGNMVLLFTKPPHSQILINLCLRRVDLLRLHIDYANIINRAPAILLNMIEVQRQNLLKRNDEKRGNMAALLPQTSDSSKIKSESPPLSHAGWIEKKGRIAPTWKRRYFILDNGVLKYYGSQSAEDLQTEIRAIHLNEYNAEKSFINNHSSLENDGHYLFLRDGTGSQLVLMFPNDESCSEWFHAISVHKNFARTRAQSHTSPRFIQRGYSADISRKNGAIHNKVNEKQCVHACAREGTEGATNIHNTAILGMSKIPKSDVASNCPSSLKGLIEKRGHIVRNWKTRFFLLRSGVLKYYRWNDSIAAIVSPNDYIPSDEDKLGEYHLLGYQIEREPFTDVLVGDRAVVFTRPLEYRGPHLRLSIRPTTHGILYDSKPTLQLRFSNDSDWFFWWASLDAHINFIKQ